MTILGTLLIVVGIIIALVGGIMFLIVAFKESVVWAIGCLVIPLVSFIFLFKHWSKASKPFFIQMGGVLIASIGGALSGGL